MLKPFCLGKKRRDIVDQLVKVLSFPNRGLGIS